jgi:glycosyltransferase involved in cell wall biosynthesis
MKILFIVDKLSRYAGTGVYAEQMVKQLGMVVDWHELLVLNQQQNWPRELRQRITEHRPDIVHVLCGRPRMIFQVGLALRGYDFTTKVVSIHNVPPHEFRIGGLYSWRSGYWYARNLRYFYSRSVFLFALRHYYDALVAVSDSTLGQLDELSRKKAYKVSEGIEYATSPEKRGLAFRDDILGEQKGPLILTVGAFIFQKGIHRMLDILPSIISEYPQVLYVVAGKKRDPAYYEYIQRLVRLRKLDQYVRLLPDTDSAVLAGLYENYDVYVQPTYEEGFCLTFLEALVRKKGSEKPFVLVGGTTGELPALLAIAGMDDFLFNASSETSFAEKMRLALKALRNGFYPNIPWQRLVETYSWEQAARDMNKLYELLICRAGCQ